MDLCNHSCLSSQLAGGPAIVHLSVLGGKTFIFGHCVQTFQPDFFIPTSTILCHFQ